MRRYDRSRQTLAIALAFLAGHVDATGFIVAGGYFTSFMSGNTTRLGVELFDRHTLPWIPLLLIGSFVTGVTIGSVIAARFQGRHKRILLAGIAGLLGVASLALGAENELVFLALAALAMGAANNVFSRDGEVTVGVTYMTGALVRTGQGLASRMMGRSTAAMRGYPSLWLALSAGAVCGTGLYGVKPVAAAGVAAALALALFLFAFRIEGRAP